MSLRRRPSQAPNVLCSFIQVSFCPSFFFLCSFANSPFCFHSSTLPYFSRPTRLFTTHLLLHTLSITRSLLMFTPPPSPLPPSFHISSPPVSSSTPSPTSTPQQFLTSGPILSLPPPKHGRCRRQPETSGTIQDHKSRIAWWTGLMVIILPLILVAITVLERSASHPLLFDLLAGSLPAPRVLLSTRTHEAGPPALVLHRRQSGALTMSSAAPSTSGTDIVFPSVTTSTSTSTSTQEPSQTIPTIPSSPPVLPTPFPQPFDTTMGNNFTTNSCQTFFTNMTQSAPFRQCRPFSFLSQTSNAFLMVSGILTPSPIHFHVDIDPDLFPIHCQAQSNLTLLNIDIWGTCNTPVDADQCASNMGWFTTTLLDACSQEKSDDNELVIQTLASTLRSMFNRPILVLMLVTRCPDRFAIILPDATSGLPGRSEYVYLLLRQGRR
jgi:hypothetical protein